MADWDVGCELDIARRLAALSSLRAEIDRHKETIAHLGRRLEAKDKALAENERLRVALFQIQCEQLDQATNIEKSAQWHRKKAMATRDRIITILK